MTFNNIDYSLVALRSTNAHSRVVGGSDGPTSPLLAPSRRVPANNVAAGWY